MLVPCSVLLIAMPGLTMHGRLARYTLVRAPCIPFETTPLRMLVGPLELPIRVSVTLPLCVMTLVGIRLGERQVGPTVVMRTVTLWLSLLPLFLTLIMMLTWLLRMQAVRWFVSDIVITCCIRMPLLYPVISVRCVLLMSLLVGTVVVSRDLIEAVLVVSVIPVIVLEKVMKPLLPVMKLALEPILITILCVLLVVIMTWFLVVTWSVPPLVPVRFRPCSYLTVVLMLLLPLASVPPYLTTLVLEWLCSLPIRSVATLTGGPLRRRGTRGWSICWCCVGCGWLGCGGCWLGVRLVGVRLGCGCVLCCYCC